MHAASRVLAAGADFVLLGPSRTMLPSLRRVVAVGAVRTGAGKSQTTRYIAAAARRARPQARSSSATRCPTATSWPSASSASPRSRTSTATRRTIEEREEYEPHIERGHGGLRRRGLRGDPPRRPRPRPTSSSGTAATTTSRSTGRPVHRRRRPAAGRSRAPLPPGRAQPPDGGRGRSSTRSTPRRPAQIAEIHASIAELNPRAQVISARSRSSSRRPADRGRRVVVVEDGPTLTHGGMHFGAGSWRRAGSGPRRSSDPRPAAVGSIRATFEKYPTSSAHPGDGLRRRAGRGTWRRRSTPSTRTSSCRRRRSTSPGSSTWTSRSRAFATTWRRSPGRRSPRSSSRWSGWPTGRARRVTPSTLPIRGSANRPALPAGLLPRCEPARPLRSGHSGPSPPIRPGRPSGGAIRPCVAGE